MATVKSVWIETANARWHVEIKERPDGYVCEFSGTTPKFAQAVRPGASAPMMADAGRGKTLGTDIEMLLADARLRIEALDGAIERET